MPHTHNLAINIDNQPVEIGELANTGVNISYALEDPENFQEKQSAFSAGINIPATPANDKIFNSFHNPNVEDFTGSDLFTNPRQCSIIVNGVQIMKGKSIMDDATHSRLPGSYSINCFGCNGDWVLDAQHLTLWDCLSNTTHTFDVDTVEASWTDFDSDEDHDYVYVPVRYRQPFGDSDDTVNIFHLRPSISIYWLLVRGFRLLGYKISSEFIHSNHFRRMVMPWVWGDFYDISSSIVDGIRFKAAGATAESPVGTVDTSEELFSGTLLDPNRKRWQSASPVTTRDYIYNTSFLGVDQNFIIDNTIPPVGFDNFSLFSFDSSTGTFQWQYNPPIALSRLLGSNLNADFSLNLIAKASAAGDPHNLNIWVEITKIPLSGSPTVSLVNIDVLSCLAGETKGNLLEPTVFEFSVNGINYGDILQFTVKYDLGADPGFTSNGIIVISSGWLNEAISGPPYYVLLRSTFELTGLHVALGNNVNFKLYDKFRSYGFLDLILGINDLFDLSIQTNPISKIVTIEPTHAVKLNDGTTFSGYFKSHRLDWTDKQDLSKENKMKLFSDMERLFEFSFKQDGSDGAQNIWAARYKGIYLNNQKNQVLSGNTIDNGIIAGVPGASRYVLPERFKKGSRQNNNAFFSATLHYRHTAWKNVCGPDTPAPQLVCIFPENINDSSAGAVTQTFEPKICFYKGLMDPVIYGGWRWIGDPAAPYTDSGTPSAVLFGLPFMFSVNYTEDPIAGAILDPVLSYSDQLINGSVVRGLMRTYFLRRLAIMRHGKQYKPFMNLGLADITDWEHRNRIIIQGGIYHLIGIDNYNPVSDDSTQCVLWRDANPDQEDLDNCFPSEDSVIAASAILEQFDLRYAQLLLFPTDTPQI